MRTKVTLVLIFLNVAVFFFVFYLKNNLPKIDDSRGILGPHVVNIKALEIAQLSRPDAIRLERRGEEWNLVRPVEWPANSFAVTRILTELQQLRSQASFAVKDLAKNGYTLADYGLDRPPVTVTFTPAVEGSTTIAEPVTLRIGETAKVGNRLYVLQPDGERIHVVNRSLVESLTVGLDQLRSDSVFTVAVFEIRSLNLQTGSPTNLKLRIARTDGRWHFESPITARAQKTLTEGVVLQLNGLRIHSFTDARSAESRQFTPEEMTLRITMEGNNRRETLLLGNKLAAAPPSPPKLETNGEADIPQGDVDYYAAKMEDKSPVFVVAMPRSLLTNLVAAQEKLRDPQIIDLDPATVTAVSIASTGQPEVTLQRLENNSGTSSAPNWEMIRRNNERGSQTVPADRSIVARLLRSLIELRAEHFVTDAPIDSALEDFGFNRPARRIQINHASVPRPGAAPGPTTTTLLIGIGVDRQTYAKLESPNYVYRVSNEILQETPVASLAYRERTLRQLPAGANITGLQLIDLATQASLLDVSLPLPASDQAASQLNPAQRNGAEALAAQLRTIRAKNFVTETFTKTITVAGEERPWKYQLTCKLALTGGNNAQTDSFTLFFSERVSGSTQLAGSPDLDVVFEAEQSLIDAIFTLSYGPRDPGPVKVEATPVR